jgi:hypothetical protein
MKNYEIIEIKKSVGIFKSKKCSKIKIKTHHTTKTTKTEKKIERVIEVTI